MFIYINKYPMDREQLSKKPIKELKELLRKSKLKVSGKKADLVDRLIDSSTKVVDLTKQFSKSGRLELGKMIINIHNNLGGNPNHPTIQRVSKLADELPEEEKHEVVQKLVPHVMKAAKKHPPVQTTAPIKKVAPEKVSAKAQMLKQKVKGELKQIKKAKGMDQSFKTELEAIFGKPK
jgi:hypothetical protein